MKSLEKAQIRKPIIARLPLSATLLFTQSLADFPDVKQKERGIKKMVHASNCGNTISILNFIQKLQPISAL